MYRIGLCVAAVSLIAGPSPSAQDAPTLKNVRKIFLQKMPNDLDQYIETEITKQLAGRLMVVLKQEDADAVLRGTSDQKTRTGAAITGRYLGLHDNATGSISLVDRDETVVLWSAEAGDRSVWWGALARGGQRKGCVPSLVENENGVTSC
jgi:hypothetical protein